MARLPKRFLALALSGLVSGQSLFAQVPPVSAPPVPQAPAVAPPVSAAPQNPGAVPPAPTPPPSSQPVADPAMAPVQPAAPAPTPPPVGNAATVNGQPIPEAAVARAMKRIPPADHAKARPEILNYLIDNLLIEQHLVAQKVTVDPKEVDSRLTEIKTELAKHKQDYEKMLQSLYLTEGDLRAQIEADMRWEKVVTGPNVDKALADLFAANPEMFDGTAVRARHILLMPSDSSPSAHEQAKAQLVSFKAQIEAKVAQGLAQLPATADPLAREQERCKLLEDAFSMVARDKSACPSSKDGGDVQWFPRVGSMVEPFAKTAFAMKPYTMSEVVQTPFGYHLILVTARKPGQPTKFEDVKEEVREVYCGRVREELLSKLRPAAQIIVTPGK